MGRPFVIAPLLDLHSSIDVLRAEAAEMGFGFVERLVADWSSGENRFDQPGEALLGAFDSDDLVAVCGLNRDPYTKQEGVGRLRHLYVLASLRRCGVASMLVRALLRQADGVFHCVRLRTATRDAAVFYATFGFVPVEDKTASHVWTPNRR